MTIQITLLGLLGGTVIGFLSGVVTTYVKVPITARSVLAAVGVIIAVYLLTRLSGWVADTYMAGVPPVVCTPVKLPVALLLGWPFVPCVPRSLRFLAPMYNLMIRGTPNSVPEYIIYFP